MTDQEKPPLTPPVKKWPPGTLPRPLVEFPLEVAPSDTIRRHRASFLLGTFPASPPASPEAAAWLTPSPSTYLDGTPVWSHGTMVLKAVQLKAPLDAGNSADPADLDIPMWKFDAP